MVSKRFALKLRKFFYWQSHNKQTA